jgi:hypothetical protein
MCEESCLWVDIASSILVPLPSHLLEEVPHHAYHHKLRVHHIDHYWLVRIWHVQPRLGGQELAYPRSLRTVVEEGVDNLDGPARASSQLHHYWVCASPAVAVGPTRLHTGPHQTLSS